MAPIVDIDYIIMTNANEDSRLWELLYDYKKDHPNLSSSEALNNLKARLTELVSEGKVGIYSMESGRSYESSEEYQDLTVAEALAVINEDRNWDVATADSEILKCLYARDRNYFGKCYQSTKNES